MTTASVIANTRAGAAALGRDGLAGLVARLEASGISVARPPRGRIGSQIRRSLADAPDIVVVAGGDGTINAVANAHRGSARPLGIVPLGTMNLLARDFGIPLAPEAAVAVIAGGHTAPVAGAELDGRLFLHSAFVGMPVRLGIHREAWRDTFGLLDAARLLWHALRSFRRDPIVAVEALDGGETVRGRSLMVLVGAAAAQLVPVPRRVPADDGRLEVIAIRPPTRLAALRVLAKGLAGMLARDEDVSVVRTARARVTSPRRRMHAMLDGETAMIRGGADLRSVPEAIRVFVPADVDSPFVGPPEATRAPVEEAP